MSIFNRGRNWLSGVPLGNSKRTVHSVVGSTRKWIPVVEVMVRNDILEGTHKIKAIPYERSYNENRKHKSL